MNPSLHLKEFVLGIVFVVVSFITFYFWRQVIGLLVDGQYHTPVLVSAGVGMLVTVVVFCLLAIFGRTLWLRYIFVGIGIAIPFFLVSVDWAVLSLMAISVLFGLFSANRMRNEYNLSSIFQLSLILRGGLSIFLSVLAIMVSTYYYVDFKEVRSVTTLLPRPLVNATAGRISAFVGFPDYDPNQKVDEYLADFISKRLADRKISVATIPKAEFRQLVADQRVDFSKQMGIPLTGNERVGDVTYIALTEKMRQILKPIQAYVPFITAAAFFLGFKTLMLPLYYVTFLILYMVIRFLTKLRFFKKEVREIEVEKLTL